MIDKTKIVGIRFTENEKKEIMDHASMYGMDMSNFIRMSVFKEIRMSQNNQNDKSR